LRANIAHANNARVFDDPDYLTTSPSAHILKVAEMTVRAMADRGELPCVRTSTGARLFRRADVERLARVLEQQRERNDPNQPLA
jgi:excisionase family DNA binding protein